MKFQNYWSNIVNAGQDIDQIMLYSERLLEHVGKFREAASKEFKKVIDRFHLPDKNRTMPL